jgi:integrase
MAVEKHQDGFRVRREVNGRRRYIGFYRDEEEAREMNAAVAEEAGDTGVPTLRKWAAVWLDRREKVEHVRGIRTERSRWRTHVESAPFVDFPLSLIDAEHGETWLDALLTKKVSALSGRYLNAKAKPLSRKTVREVVILVRQCLDDAIPKHIATNPFALLLKRLKKASKKHGAEATEEPWTYLEPDEQARVRTCAKIPEAHRLMIAFAMLSGLREGEQFNLQLPDLVVDGTDPHAVIRFGANGEPTKNGKIRRLPLSDDLLEVSKRWLEILPTYAPENPHQLVFPLPTGARVQPGKHALYKSVKVEVKGKTKVRKVDLFRAEYLHAAGIVAKQRHDRRAVRWHDLRHTAGSSLVAGWWGRRWTLEEVKEYLGHSSILVTQRYAHLGQTALKKAVRETNYGAVEVPHRAEEAHQRSRPTPRKQAVGRQGLEPWTYGLKERRVHEQFPRLTRPITTP